MSSEWQDVLTGLYSRGWLYDAGVRVFSRDCSSLLYLDLDNFKSVNDLYGHAEGDRVLRHVAKCLQSCAKDGLAVRMSGDEFVLLLPGVSSKSDIQRIFRSLAAGISAGQREMVGLSLISLSAGAVISEPSADLRESLHRGDLAMYEAKRTGKRRCVFYDEIQTGVQREERILSEVADAITRNRFRFQFRPMVHLKNGSLLLTQAVPVWVRPDGSQLFPEEYRPVLEGNGFIRTLDFYLLEKFLGLLNAFRFNTGRVKKHLFSLEISWTLLLDDRLERMLAKAAAERRADLGEIDLSISEMGLNTRNIERVMLGIGQVQSLGVTFSLRDFGANFSAIRYIHSAPIQTIILSERWLRSSLADPEARRIVKSVLRLCKELHKRSIAQSFLTRRIGRLSSAADATPPALGTNPCLTPRHTLPI